MEQKFYQSPLEERQAPLKHNAPHLKVVSASNLYTAPLLVQRAPVRKTREKKPINTSSFLEGMRCLAAHPKPLRRQGTGTKSHLRVLLRLFEAKCVAFYKLDGNQGNFAVEVAVGRQLEQLTAISTTEGILGKPSASVPVQQYPEGIAFAVYHQEEMFGVILVREPSRTCSTEMMETLSAQLNLAFRFEAARRAMARQRNEIESALSSIKRLKCSRDKIWSDVSEELLSPLAVLRTHLSILAEKPLENWGDEVSNSISACHRSAAKLHESIDALILSSRLRQGQMKLDDRPVGFKQLMSECVEKLQQLQEFRPGGIEFDCRSEHFLRGDRRKLFEVIYSLMELGLLSSRANRVSVVLRKQPHGSVVLGISYTQESKDKNPRPFTSRLENAQKVIEMHGGFLQDISRDHSIQIRISLPVFLGSTSSFNEPSGPRSNSKILLVEDDIDCRNALQELLELEGYGVNALGSVEEALAWLHVEKPSLVLLDLWLGERRGMDVLHYIRQERTLMKLPVFLVSGSRQLSSFSKGRGINRIDGFFEKPYPMARLLSQISRYVIPTSNQRQNGGQTGGREAALSIVRR